MAIIKEPKEFYVNVHTIDFPGGMWRTRDSVTNSEGQASVGR
jgi:hypothetical protein